MAILIIGGVNCNNHYMVNQIAGDFGYLGGARVVDDCTYKIALLLDGVDDRGEVESMIGRYALSGFCVSVKEAP